MKRIKIMLLSFTLLAIVGGALAFKAKFKAYDYCTTDQLIANQTCTLLGNFTDDSPNKIYYTTPYDKIGGGFICETRDEEGDLTTVTCTTSTFLLTE